MTDQKSSYRQIVKATSLFGGVQIFNIIIGIIRSKFVAVLLGPAGIGIYGLLTSTLGMISGLTNFGLATSAVKDISAAHATGDQERVSLVVAVLRRLVWITGLLGSASTLVMSPWLSRIAFGNSDYALTFVLISGTLLLNQISAGQSVLLRGMRQIRYMAQSGVIGSILGLVTTIPLYYKYGVKGIVPAIIITSATGLLVTWHFATKIKVKPAVVTLAKTLAEGGDMLKMGFMVSLSGLITLGASYVVRIFISNTGGVEQVGLYNSGFAIINTYVGMIFTAMGADYYPRLAAVAGDDAKCREEINQQAEIALLIMTPVIILFLAFIKWVVVILYSTKFVPVKDMILWAAMGMLFKSASWAVAFIFLSKGDSRLFFWNELFGNLYVLTLNIIGYKIWGLEGLGISFLIGYVFYLIQVMIFSGNKYKFSFNKNFYAIFGVQFAFCVICFIGMKILSSPYNYLAGVLLFVASGWYSYRELDKRLDMRSVLVSVRNKFK